MTITASELYANKPAGPLTGQEIIVITQDGESRGALLAALKGADGRQVELGKTDTDIVWRYVGEAVWQPLIPIADLKGDKGAKVLMRKGSTNIEYQHEGDTTWTGIVPLEDLRGDPGKGLTPRGAWAAAIYQPGDYVTYGTSIWILRDSEPYNSASAPPLDTGHWMEWQAPAGQNGREVQLRKGATAIEWRYVGDADWIALVPLADLKGNDGLSPEMQKTATHIQWRQGTSGTWINLVALVDLKGDPGRGVPAGGAVGQMLVKKSATDFDLEFKDVPTGGGGGGMNLTGDQTASGVKTFSTRIVTGAPPGTGAPTVPANAGLVAYPPSLFDGQVTMTKRASMMGGTKNDQVLPVTVTAGACTLQAYNPQQRIGLTADVSTLTIKLPDASGNSEGNIYPIIEKGSIFKIFVPFAVAAVTIVPGKNSFWWADTIVIGAPAALRPGMYEIQFMPEEAWYFSR